MITELTEEQKAQIPVYRDMSMGIGLATGPCDREMATKAIKDLYEFSEKTAPEHVVFVESVVAAQAAIQLLKEDFDKYLPLLLNRKGAVVEEFPGVKVSSFEETHGYGYGSAECYWVYYYQYWKDQVGIEFDQKALKGLDIMDRLARSSYWHFLFEGVAIMVDRFEEVHMENGVVHNENGPAVRFSDNQGTVWAIGGHLVTEKIVMAPETLTLEEIDAEEDAETRRIMIERYGPSKYLMESEAKVLDMDALNLEGSSPRSLMEDKHGNRWLIGTDGSTGRVYHMAVPEEANTCQEAHNMICGFDESRQIAEC